MPSRLRAESCNEQNGECASRYKALSTENPVTVPKRDPDQEQPNQIRYYHCQQDIQKSSKPVIADQLHNTLQASRRQQKCDQDTACQKRIQSDHKHPDASLLKAPMAGAHP